MSKTKKKPVKNGRQVHRDMPIFELVTLFPDTVEIMAEYGLYCAGCALGGNETLAEGCRLHGFTQDVIDDLLTDLNDAVAEKAAKSQEVFLSDSAARELHNIAQKEGETGKGLAVAVDELGNFSLEFQAQAKPADRVFRNLKVPEVCIFVDPFTLARIGGATIDFREKRFKLDLPD